MSALDRIHRFNVGVVKAFTLASGITHQASAVVVGAGLIFLAWWAPAHYGFHLHGWWLVIPGSVMAFGAFGIWEGTARIIAITRSPPAPLPTTPETW
jgi:hypothetical protein